jgi:hypothetical protein
MREREIHAQICYRAVGTMFRIFSVIIETIKDPLLRRLIRPSAQEFRKPSLPHRALPTRPPSGVGASWPAISTTSRAASRSKISCSGPDGTPADRSDGETPGHLNLRPFRPSGRCNRFRVRYRSADFGRRLVFAQAFVDDLAERVVVGPSQVFHLGDKLGPRPMDAAQRRAARRTGCRAAAGHRMASRALPAVAGGAKGAQAPHY